MADQTEIKAPLALRIETPHTQTDFPTLLGLLVAFSLVGAALAFGGSYAAFFNIPAFFIVVGGTLAVTAISYTTEDLRKAASIIRSSLVYKVRDPRAVARGLVDIAAMAKQKGVLALTQQDEALRKDPYINYAMGYVMDGFQMKDVEQILRYDLEALADRHRVGAGILRRASEVAPAMGLIGTLVGLVQMLSTLNDPSSIGPAMAVALLTTFYGALMGTMMFAPMAAKLERNAAHDYLVKNLILSAALSIAKQESPRKLEIVLNAALPPDHKIQYFK